MTLNIQIFFFLKEKTRYYHGLSHRDRHFCFNYKQFSFHQYTSEKHVLENNERYVLVRSEDNKRFYFFTSKTTYKGRFWESVKLLPVHSLKNLLWRAVWFSFSLLNCYLHKENVSDFSFEDCFFFSLFPTSRKKNLTSLLAICVALSKMEAQGRGPPLCPNQIPGTSCTSQAMAPHRCVCTRFCLPVFKFLDNW